jgi:hypothetical protein
MANNNNNLVPAWQLEELGNKGLDHFVPQPDLPRQARSRAPPVRFVPEATDFEDDDDDSDLDLGVAAAAPSAAAAVVVDDDDDDEDEGRASTAELVFNDPPIVDLTGAPAFIGPARFFDLSSAPSPFDESQEVIPVNMKATDEAMQSARFNYGIPGDVYYAPDWYHPRTVIPDKSILELNSEGKVLGWMEPMDDVMDVPPMSAGELARRSRRHEAMAEAADASRKRLRGQ